MLLVIFYLFITTARSEYDDVYKLYTPDPRDMKPLGEAMATCGKINPVFQDLKFIKTGLTGILWDSIIFKHISNFKSSTRRCFQDIQTIHHRSKQGSAAALKFLDASSSSPVGLLEGTMTNFGDFDQCINIRDYDLGHRVNGKYFHVILHFVNRDHELEHLDYPTNRPDERNRSGICDWPRIDQPIEQKVHMYDRGMEESGVTLSLCLPDSCSNDNLFEILSEVLKCHPNIYFRNDIKSDTLESLSLSHKLSNLSILQLIAIIILSVTIMITILATFLDVKIGFIRYFDARENFYDLTHVKKGESVRSLFLDMNKFIILFSAIMAHIGLCAESPRALAMYSHINFPKKLLKNIWCQIFVYEGTFTGLAFFSGLATFNEIFPLIMKDNFNYKQVIINKWLRYLPGLVGLLSLELIWPLIGHGPLYNQVAEYNTNKVESYWWSILLFVGNFNSYDQTPVLHTNYSMIDFQLYLLGIVGIYLLVKDPKRGFIFSLAMIFCGFLSLAYFMSVYNVQPHYVHPSALIRRLLLNLRFVHFHIHTYIPMYFMGILSAYIVKYLDYHQTNWKLCTRMAGICYTIPILFPIAYFYFKIIPEWATPIYLIAQKLVIAKAIIWNFLRDDIEEREAKNKLAGKQLETLTYEKDELTLITAAYKMSIATYFTNYWFVRIDFFTRRDVWYTGIYSLATREVYGLLFIYVLGLLFHLTFFMPFTKWRKSESRSKDED